MISDATRVTKQPDMLSGACAFHCQELLTRNSGSTQLRNRRLQTTRWRNPQRMYPGSQRERRWGEWRGRGMGGGGGRVERDFSPKRDCDTGTAGPLKGDP